MSFYLYPNFLNFKEQLKKIGIVYDYQVSSYLIDNYNIFTTPGSDYYSPPEELSIRLSLVDFDGKKALEQIEYLKLDPNKFSKLFENIDTGITKIIEFVTKL